jgi:hypothetical protein
MMIDETTFGKLVFQGKVYRSDCIIYKNNIDGKWWRNDGLKLTYDEIKRNIKENPQVIIIGKGYMNMLVIDESDIMNKFQPEGIELIIEDTSKAVETFNALEKKKKVIGFFHLY